MTLLQFRSNCADRKPHFPLKSTLMALFAGGLAYTSFAPLPISLGITAWQTGFRVDGFQNRSIEFADLLRQMHWVIGRDSITNFT